jgi:hypothetical protein
MGIDTDYMEMVRSEDGGHIPAQYQEFVEVIIKEKAETLRQYWPIYHAIDLEPDYNLPS